MAITSIFNNITKQKITRRLSLAVAGSAAAGILFLGTIPVASAMPETLPVTELVKGMTGQAYTVVDSSNEIRTFDVEIMGVLGTGRGTRRMILARASGPVVESVGGVLQGMSGSPVYIDGRLVGAAAATFKDMDAYMFLITPIEDMMEIWNMPDPKAVSGNKKIDLKKVAAEKEKAAKAREQREKLRKIRQAGGKDEAGEKGKEQTGEESDEVKFDGQFKEPEDGSKGKEPEAGAAPVKDNEYPTGYMKVEEVIAPADEGEETAKKKSRYFGERRRLFISGFDGAAAGILADRLAPLGYDLQPFMGVYLAGGSGAGLRSVAAEEKRPENQAETSEKTGAEKPADDATAETAAEKPANDKTAEPAAEKPAEKQTEETKEKTADKGKKKEKKSADKKKAEETKQITGKENNIPHGEELKPDYKKPDGKKPEDEKPEDKKPDEPIEVREPSGPVAIDFEPELEPGSPVGVAAVHGDFTVGATGTVTAVEGKKVLAFGHAFANKGNTNFFMTNVTVIGTVNGQTDGMKLANVGNIIGRINQDRGSGIAGILGVYPGTVPMRLKVADRFLNRTMYFAAQCAYDEDLLPAVTAAIPVAAIARTCDSGAPATIGVKFKVKTNVFAAQVPPEAPQPEKNLDIERSNLFYSVGDGGLSAFAELNNIISIITSNQDEESDIYSIDVEITADARRRTARLISATPSKPEVKAGETITFKAVLKPYRGEKFTVDVPYTIPEERPEGRFFIDLHGGGLVQVQQVLAAAAMDLEGKATTTDKLRRILDTYSNNHIVAEPAANPPLMSDKEQRKEIKKAIKRAEELERKRRETEDTGKKPEPGRMPEPTETDYIIENFIQTSVVVKS